MDRLANAALLVLALCALGMTGVILRDHWVATRPTMYRADVPEPTWKHIIATGHSIGPSNSQATLAIFSDYQCPACRAYSRILLAIRRKYGNSVRLVYHNYPLDSVHPLAHAAAVAADCSASMGRFVAYDSLLFANADLLEQQRWEELASKAGIVDTSHFRSCTVSDHAEVELAQDVEEGDQLGINATPTVMLNGHIFVGPPRELVLDSVIARTLASGE